jgi:hypothetical protein
MVRRNEASCKDEALAVRRLSPVASCSLTALDSTQMPSPRGFSLLLTASQAASRLGVPIQTVLGWAAAGELRIAGQDEDGRALFREAVIDGRGTELAEADRAKPRHSKQTPNIVSTTARTPLPCGCDLERPHLSFCRDGLALSTALQFAEFLTFVMPDDPLLRRSAEACRDALMRHLNSTIDPMGELAAEHTASNGMG